LKKDELDVNLQDSRGWTALIKAIDHGVTDIVIELLSHGKVDANHENHEGDTALLRAITKGDTDMVVELLKHTSQCQS
jgi:ankyrin repeat protein